ncbi:MAG: hypothetical protein Tsb0034_01140 [Ekhidna sp.]
MFANKYRYLYIALLGVYSFLNIKFTEGDKILSNKVDDTTLACAVLLITLVVWESNHFIQKLRLGSSFRLSNKLIIKFGMSLIAVMGISVLASLLIGNISADQQTLPGFKQTLGFAFRINLFLHCINAIYQYNSELGKSKLEAERLKKESTEAKLDALRKQISPHFLFNSLNILSSVIEKDGSLAIEYVKKLSTVYRYLLKNEQQPLVSLKEELDFLEAYIFLLRIRFQEGLHVSIDIKDAEHQQIPPSTLQLLIENAIKHNEISKSKPLSITIGQSGSFLIISNTKQPRRNKTEASGIGLQNITNRYRLLSIDSPTINEQKDEFTVQLPIITKV